MNELTRYLCPLACGWHHDYSRLPDIVSLMDSSEEDLAKAMFGHAQAVERVLRKHLESHPPEEWVMALLAARQERDKLADELRSEREQAQIVREWMRIVPAAAAPVGGGGGRA